MSLVSVINYFGNPFIVSDIAFSLPGSQDRTIVLPSTNNWGDFSENAPYIPIKFGLKTLIIQDKLFVGFVGIVADLEEACANIKDFFLYRFPNSRTITDLYEEFDFSSYQNSSFLFILIDSDETPNNIIIYKFGNWTETQILPGITMSSAGSGAIEWDKQTIATEHLGFNGPENLDSFKQRILRNCMNFLSYERGDTAYLSDGWGGGFDIAYINDNQWSKLNNIAYIFWIAIANSDGNYKLSAIINNSYIDDMLVIRNVGNHFCQGYAIRELNDFRPINKTYSTVFEVDHIVSSIFFRDQNDNVIDIIVSHDFTPGDIEVSLHNSRIVVKFDSKIKQTIKEVVIENS